MNFLLSLGQECCNVEHKEATGHAIQHIDTATQEQARMLEIEIAEAQQSIMSNTGNIRQLEAEIGKYKLSISCQIQATSGK